MDSAYVKMVKKTFKTLLIKMPLEVKSEIYNQTISNTKWSFYCTLGSSQKKLVFSASLFCVEGNHTDKKKSILFKANIIKK